MRVLCRSRNGREPVGKSLARGVSRVMVAEYRQHADACCIQRGQHGAQVRVFLGGAGIHQIAGQHNGLGALRLREDVRHGACQIGGGIDAPIR